MHLFLHLVLLTFESIFLQVSLKNFFLTKSNPECKAMDFAILLQNRKELSETKLKLFHTFTS